MKKYLIFTITAFLIVFLQSSEAAVIYTSTGGSLNFEVTPKNPSSFSTVTVKAISFEINLNNASISWFLNGKLEKEGLGQSSFSFTTGKSGQTSTVKIIAKIDDKKIEKIMEINPADVDILWEAETYTPPTYKGKALASSKSNVRVIAIPQLISEKGLLYNPSELIYEWTDGSRTLNQELGKSSIMVSMGSPYGKNSVSVKVLNAKGNISAEKTIAIEPQNPKIIFYEEKPLEGTKYENALKGTAEFSEAETSVRAEPYFFSFPETPYEKNLAYSWTMNGKGITPNEGTPKVITLRNETGKEILSSLTLSIKNVIKTFQTAYYSVTIKSVPEAMGF